MILKFFILFVSACGGLCVLMGFDMKCSIIGRVRLMLVIFMVLCLVFWLQGTAFAGLLLNVAQSNLDMGSVTVGSGNDFYGSLGLMTVSDDRAGSPGWSLVGTASHMTTIRPAMRITGSAGGVTSGGVYDGMLGVTIPTSFYTITINQGGAVGTATFNVSGAELMSNVVTGTFVAIGTKGVRVTFDVGNYSVGDEWMVGVDELPYTDMTIAPGNVTVNSGSGTGVSGGSSGVLSGTGVRSDNKILMQAMVGNGTGSYSITPDLSVHVHAAPMAGIYTGELLFTVS